MKVLLLGTGAMGAKAAEIVTGFDEIAQLTAADISIGSAQACAARCNRAHPGKAQAMQLDATDPAALRSAMQAHDAVLNLAGPFFRFAVPVLKAAIDTRTAYLDICYDPEPTLDMLALDAEARAAGTLAIIGMGQVLARATLLPSWPMTRSTRRRKFSPPGVRKATSTSKPKAGRLTAAPPPPSSTGWSNSPAR